MAIHTEKIRTYIWLLIIIIHAFIQGQILSEGDILKCVEKKP